jgi:hypothetical protein
VQNTGSTAAGRNNNQGGMMGNGQGGNNQGGMMGNGQGGMMNTSPAGTILLKNFKHISTSCNPS